VKAVTIPSTGKIASDKLATGCQAFRRASHHRGQEEAKQEQNVVVGRSRYMTDAFAKENSQRESGARLQCRRTLTRFAAVAGSVDPLLDDAFDGVEHRQLNRLAGPAGSSRFRGASESTVGKQGVRDHRFAPLSVQSDVRLSTA